MIKRIGLILFVLLALSIPTFSWNGNATGGTVTTIIDGGVNYTIHTFTANGTFSVSGTPINATVLVVAGGGGGGSNPSTGNGGGGGAGGLIYNTSYNATGAITVVIGSGGAVDTNGQNSSFGTLIAVGGGKGGKYYNTAGGAGGSGGGGGQETAAGGSGTAGQGNAGGAANTTIHSGGGGGGAGGAGQKGVTKGGAGGTGLNYSINGTTVWYACGGAGSTHNSIDDYQAGGICGGGDGQGKSGGVARAPTPGVNGTGGGGGAGGESKTGAIGGNGIVIVRYETPPQFNVTVTQPEADGFYTINDVMEEIRCYGDLPSYILNVYLDGEIIDSNYEVENDTPFFTYNYMSDGAHLLYATCTNGTKTVQSPDIDFIVQGAPKMNITAPLDGTTGLSSTIAFGYYGTSLEAEISCIVFLDGILNQTEPLYQQGTYAQFVINNIANGAHTIEVSCTDSYASEGSTGEVGFVVTDTSGGGGNVTGSNGFWVSRYCLMPSISNRAAPMTFFTRLGR
ncbi:MAG: hypothetical protein PHS46_08640 [Candidatus Omnitrophica bacterium]|nr:hypothetical protein [Candidatus Omnitrophota bacterium]